MTNRMLTLDFCLLMSVNYKWDEYLKKTLYILYNTYIHSQPMTRWLYPPYICLYPLAQLDFTLYTDLDAGKDIFRALQEALECLLTAQNSSYVRHQRSWTQTLTDETLESNLKLVHGHGDDSWKKSSHCTAPLTPKCFDGNVMCELQQHFLKSSLAFLLILGNNWPVFMTHDSLIFQF